MNGDEIEEGVRDRKISRAKRVGGGSRPKTASIRTSVYVRAGGARRDPVRTYLRASHGGV